jgi:outer membrane protein
MKTKFLLLGIILSGKFFSQGNSFSLQQALDYAFTHNAAQLNAELESKSQAYYRKQVLGAGFPQINGSLDVKDFVDLPTSLLPGQFFGAPAGTFIPVKFGVKWNATAGVNISQLVFSTDYLLGIKAAKELSLLSEKNVLRTKAETAQSVYKAYYSVLVNRERIKLLDANIARLKKILEDTRAMNKAGFVENIDVDRLEVAFNNLNTEKTNVNRLIGLSETVLKFQMGFKIADQITLTDSLSSADKNPITINENQKTAYSLRPEFALVESQQKLNMLNLKRFRLSPMPSLVAYGAFSAQAQRTEFDFFDTKKDWYPIGIIGATLNIPIFDGFQNINRIKQAKITVLKTKNTLDNLQQAIDMEISIASISYQNAINSMESQRKNMKLAQNILDVANKKYEQGLGSNLEIINAQTSLKEAETNYFNSLYDMFVAKVDYLKASGSLVK